MAAPCNHMRVCIHRNLRRFIGIYTESLTVPYRCCSSLAVQQNFSWRLDPEVEAQISERVTKARNHPGQVALRRAVLPDKLLDAISILSEKYSSRDLQSKAAKLVQYLEKRQRPRENDELKYAAQQLEQQRIMKDGIDLSAMTRDELEVYGEQVRANVLKDLKKRVYHWKPVQYDAYTCLMYVVGMMPMNYACLLQIFREIRKRNSDFKPETLFDFGSGVGSSIWSSNEVWRGSIQEHYCVDSSQDMNTAARLLLQGGDEDQDMCFPGLYFRQFMPLSVENKSDLVVSAFSLMELRNQQERLETLFTLWAKTKNYLVIVEPGTLEGYNLVMEARAFLLDLPDNPNLDLSEEDRESLHGHVFAPCSHDGPCHQLMLNRSGEGSSKPCNFPVTFKPLLKTSKGVQHKTARMSYIVLKKGHRQQSNKDSWPRLLQDMSVHRGHRAVAALHCSPNGRLERSVLTESKHGKLLYRVAKASRWGDLLPVVEAEHCESREEWKDFPNAENK